MRRFFIFLLVLLVGNQLYAQLSGKRETPYGFEINVIPPIYYDHHLTFTNDINHPVLNLVISIQNDLLYFTKTDHRYEAGYDISLFVKDSATEETVFSNLIKEKVVEKNFQLTNSTSEYQKKSKNYLLNIPPGDYDLFLKLTDETTGNSFRSKRKIQLPDTKLMLSATEIKLYRENDSTSAEIIVDDSKVTVPFNQDYKTHLEVIAPDQEKISVKSDLYIMEDEDRIEISSRQFDVDIQNALAVIEENLKKEILREGDYLLSYTITGSGQKRELEKKFSVIWYDKPVFLYDLELAIKPLIYILSEAELEEMQSLTDSDLKNWFDNFWKTKDPEPQTPYNEIQDEFYERVSQADRRFSDEYTDGWTTDRGKAFILYGQPDRIDKHHYQIKTKPYEIWYFDSLNKKLVFMDVNDDNIFKLVRVDKIGENKNE